MIKWSAILFLVVSESLIIYLFAVKEYGCLGIILIGIIFAGFLIIIYPYYGGFLVIAFVFSNFGPLIGGGIFSILLFYVICAMLISKYLNGEKFINHQINVGILVFTFFVLISLITAEVKELALEHFFQYVKCVLVFFCVINLITKKKYIRYAYIVIVSSSAILALYSIHRFLTSGISGLRFSGVTRDPNYLALILVPTIPLAISIIKTQKNLFIRVMMILSIIFCISTILMTYSRGGVLALSVTFLWVIYDNRKKKIFSFLSIIVLIILVYLFITEFSHYKKLIHLVSKDTSFMQRLNLYQGGLKMIIDRPIWGVGLGNFLIWSSRYAGLVTSLVAHNIFLQVGGETGVFGLMAFIFILGSAWFSIRRSQGITLRNKDSELNFLTVGLKISLFSFLVGSMFLTSHFDYALWVLLALAIVIERIATYTIRDVAV